MVRANACAYEYAFSAYENAFNVYENDWAYIISLYTKSSLPIYIWNRDVIMIKCN